MTLTIKHIDYRRGVALVQGARSTFPVTVAKPIQYLISIGDLATVKKSPVSGEWIMTDYTARWGDDV